MRQRPIPVVVTVGRRRFPRYVIRHPGGGVWTGEGWSGEGRRAALFAEPEAVSRAWEAMMRHENRDLTARERFLVPVNVEVLSREGVDHEALAGWLRKAVVFELDYVTHGCGPAPETVVFLEACWGNMEPTDASWGPPPP